MSQRFTIDGSDALEQHLAQTCSRVVSGVREIIPNGRLEALLLGGGYGRGQGGVLKTTVGDKPYNDLEFYVCLQGNEILNQKKYRDAFHHLAERLSPEAGLEVEFKITSLNKLQQTPPTMFSYDLACGHRALEGNSVPAFDSSLRQADKIPLTEATRLLMNRCSGLLYASEHLQRKPFTAEDADFVSRNHSKAQLAFGDVFLTAHGQYHWDCRERNRRLIEFSPEHNLPWLEEVRRHHVEGVAFKLHPCQSRESLEVLCDRQRTLTHLGSKVWLWLESERLGRIFTSARDYALSKLDKCPETNPLKNLLINLKTFGAAGLSDGKAFRYPRERLLHALSLLLWEPKILQERIGRDHLRSELNANALNFKEWVDAYERIWKNFN